MHSEVGERCCRHTIRVKPASDRNAECDGMFGQQLVYVAGVPARVPELQYPAAGSGQQPEKLSQAGQVELLVGWELEQNGSQLAPQMIGSLEEQLELIAYLAQPLDMSDVAACFDRKLKPRRRGVAPALEHLRGRQAIERVVQLDGPELGPVVGQLLPRRKARRIEKPLSPVAVHVPRGPQP